MNYNKFITEIQLSSHDDHDATIPNCYALPLVNKKACMGTLDLNASVY